MYKILLFLFGILLMSVGLFFLIIYLNLFTLGYSFFEFVKFIIMRIEVLIFFLGIILILIAIGGRKINELRVQFINKHERR